MFYNFKNLAQSQLNGAIDNSQTSFDVDAATAFPAVPFIVKIDNEFIRVTSVSSNTLTGDRGIEGSTAASHSDNAPVYNVLTEEGLLGLLNGDDNTMGGQFSQILAGQSCEIEYDEFSGRNAIVSGSTNTIGSAESSVIVGGAVNTLDNNDTVRPTNCVILGGANNTISPEATEWHVYDSAIVAGQYHNNKGDRTVILGGESSTAHFSAKNTVMLGSMADAGYGGYDVVNAMIHGHNFNGFQGECQLERHLESCYANTSTPNRAYTDGASVSKNITLPVNCWATGTVKAIGVGQYGQSFHRIINFAASNLGFGTYIHYQTPAFSTDVGGSGPDVLLVANLDNLYATCSGTDSYWVKWFLCWEFVRLNTTITSASS